MRVLDVTFDQPSWMRHPMQRFIAETDAVDREELVAWTPGDGVEYLLFLVSGDEARYRTAIDAVDSVATSRLSSLPDGRFYAYVVQRTRAEDRTWRRAFAERDLVVTYPIVYDGEGRMRLTVVGADEDLSALLEALPGDIAVTVHSVRPLDQPLTKPAGRLTDRQRTALRTALSTGYYDVPRRGSLAAVAARLDCSNATASELLRRAERALVSAVVGE